MQTVVFPADADTDTDAGHDAGHDARTPGSALPLSVAMREGSRRAHEAAEASPFVQQVMTGRVQPAVYLAYLERLHAVYTRLEEVADSHRGDRAYGALHDERLARSAALAADVGHWRTVVPSTDRHEPQSRAVADYRGRLGRASERPWLLVAHHYTRYLGDLSGGRILHRRLRDRFGSDAGLSFYDFPRITDPVAFKRSYRDRLDMLLLSPDQRRDVVAEVVAAFGCNRRLLDELDSDEAPTF